MFARVAAHPRTQYQLATLGISRRLHVVRLTVLVPFAFSHQGAVPIRQADQLPLSGILPRRLDARTFAPLRERILTAPHARPWIE